MKDEVAATVVFVTRLVKRNKNLSKEQCDKFSDKLTNILVEKFKSHWHADKPFKGQAYRCIRINEFEPTDQVLQQAAGESGLDFEDLFLPCELTIWTDPSEVSCRIGECKGSCITVASFKNEKIDNQALTLNIDEMVEEYHKKKLEDMAKLLEFSGKRSPVNTPPPSNGNIYKNGMYSNGSAGKWRNPQNFNRMRPFFGSSQVIRNDCVFYHQPGQLELNEEKQASVMDASDSTISVAPSSMKTGHNSQPSSKDRYRWVKNTEPAKA